MGFYKLVYNKYYVDEIYDALFVNRAKDLGLALGAFDANVIDGLGVNGAGWLTRAISRISIWWDTWIVDGSVKLGARLVWVLSFPVRMMQAGLVQSYMLFIVIGLDRVPGVLPLSGASRDASASRVSGHGMPCPYAAWRRVY